MSRPAFSVVLLAVVTGLASCQDADPIKLKLEKAKATYEKDSRAYRDGVQEWFAKREQAARASGDKKAVDELKAERETFEASSELPKSAPFTLRMRDVTARKAMAAAYAEAVKEYTKAKKDVEAAAVEEDLIAFEKASESILPKGGRQPAAGAWPVGFNPCARPTERAPASHEKLVASAKTAGPVDMVLIGDGHVIGLQRGPGKAAWAEAFGTQKVFNLGVSNDRTENILWRLTEGKALADLSPKLIILQAGNENLDKDAQKGPTAEQIAGGVKAIVTELRKQKPNAKVLILGLTPYGGRVPADTGDITPAHLLQPKVKVANAMLARLDNRTTVRFVDVGSKLLDRGGNLPKSMMQNANYHGLTSEAYRLWVSSMQGPVADLLKE